MQQQGIRSVMPQGAQAPMPGQAPMQTQPMPGMMPSQSGPKPGLTAFVPSLTGLEIPQMLQLFGDPNSPIPKNRVLAAIVEKQKEMAARKSVQNQLAMQQNAGQQPPIAQQVLAQAQQMQAAEQPPVMAAYGGEMHGYAGGGAVAFDKGGLTLGYAPDYEDARRLGIDLSPYDPPAVRAEKLERLKKMREFEKSMAANRADIPVDTSKLFPGGPPEVRMPIPEIEVAPPAAQRPTAGISQARPQPRPQAAPSPLQQLGSAVEQTGTPARDRLAEIEAEGVTGIKALQDVVRQQGTVDPELMKLREAAYKSSQDIAARRESDRQAMLKAAGAPMSQNLFDNQEALFRMLGAMKGGKRIGDAFSSIGQEAGNIRGEQRKEMQRVQELGRQEQIAIDQLNQALADKRVADRSGDVNLQRQADLKVAEAQLKVTDLRSSIQEKRATEADRAEQRRLTARGQDLQRLSSQEQTAATLKAASMRGTGELTESQKANFREKATDNVRQDKNLPLLLQNAKIEAQKTGRPFDQQKFIDTLIQREYNRIVGKETPAAPAAGGIDPDILKLFKVTPVGG